MQDDALLAYQVGFDLVENELASFLAKVSLGLYFPFMQAVGRCPWSLYAQTGHGGGCRGGAPSTAAGREGAGPHYVRLGTHTLSLLPQVADELEKKYKEAAGPAAAAPAPAAEGGAEAMETDAPAAPPAEGGCASKPSGWEDSAREG